VSNNGTHGELNIVVVGEDDAKLRGELASAGRITVVDDFLQAMGEMSKRRVDVVVGRDVPQAGEIEPTVRSLRQLGPEARLLLLADPASEPAAMTAVRHGFDDYLVEPLRGGELREALASVVRTTPRLPVEVEAEAEAESPPKSPAPAEPNPAPAGDELGLLKTLLSERGSVREGVITALRKRYGQDLHWAAEPDLNARHCVPINHIRDELGYLLSDTLGDQQLSAGAEWAAHWLAVEQRMTELKHDANHDDLTGAWNRRYFDRFLKGILQRAREQRFRVTLLLFDIDDFKRYNDEYGHPAGDEILREAARLMQTVVRRHDVVARIGGDEFGVIFWDAEAPRREQSEHPRSARRAARRFQQAICNHLFPKLSDCAPGTLTISGGLASYPWDGSTPEELMRIADIAALESKRSGKNAITLGPGASRECGMEGESENRGQTPEDRGQWTDARGQTPEDRGQTSEDSRRRPL